MEANHPSPLEIQANLSEATDEALLLAYRDGSDRELFDELVRRYERELFSYLRRYLGNAEMAEDVLQQTLLQLHLKCDQFDPSKKFRPWLYTIATHQAIDAQRKNKRHRMVSMDRRLGDGEDTGTLGEMLADPSEVSVDAVDDEDAYRVLMTRVEGEIPNLTAKQQAILRCIFFGEGMKGLEAAAKLQIPHGTVKSQSFTAIGRLREILRPAA